MKYDYTVIGAGVSGITSAIILAQNNFKVALIEKSKKTAPVIRGFSRKGIFFDTGFHYTGSLRKGDFLDLVFRYLGISDKIETKFYNEECFDFFRFLDSEFEFPFPFGFEKIIQNLQKIFPEEKTAIDIYIKAIRDTYYSFPFISLNHNNNSSNGIPGGVHGLSLKSFLDGLTGNKRLKSIFYQHCLLHGVLPNEIPFINHAATVGSFYECTHGIKGGGLSLAKAFDSRLKELGVDLYCGHGVEKILISENKNVAGVQIKDHGEIECQNCISTIHPLNFCSIIPRSFFRPAFINRIKGLEETSPAHMIYAVCDSPVKSLIGSNIYLIPDTNPSLMSENKGITERPIYITSAEQIDSSQSNSGFIAITPALYSETDKWAASEKGSRPDDYVRLKDKHNDLLIKHIEKNCPEIKGKISYLEGATALTMKHYANSPFGSLYGVKHKIGQHNPSIKTKINGLYLAGQAVVAPGILGAVVSAFMVLSNIVGYEKFVNELGKV